MGSLDTLAPVAESRNVTSGRRDALVLAVVRPSRFVGYRCLTIGAGLMRQLTDEPAVVPA